MATKFDRDSVEMYKFTHGQTPKGYGLWSFGLGRNGAWTDFQFEGKYAEAKRAAIREARGLGCEIVAVNT